MDKIISRLHSRAMEDLKIFFGMTAAAFGDGACFFITDLSAVIYKQCVHLDLPGLEVGTAYFPDRLAAKAINAQRVVMDELDPETFGIRARALTGPLWLDDGSAVAGTWTLVVPREQKIVQAFDTFAPVLAEMLPEGGVLSVTDKHKFVKRKGSKKFDMPKLQVGVPLRPGSPPEEAQKQKKMLVYELSETEYGFPVFCASAPLLDQDTGEAVGSFNLMLPRKLAKELRGFANTLNDGLTGASASIEQITAATQEAGINQSRLHEEIEKVKEQLEKINNVMGFVKEIADETNMLGLNAAIEAARVGDAGRGFGVVAEEIRKLSLQSRNTVDQIKNLTMGIDKAINETASASQSTLAVIEETSAAVQEVNATVSELNNLANRLVNTAENL